MPFAGAVVQARPGLGVPLQRYVIGVDMTTGRKLCDIGKWNFTTLEDRRRYSQVDPGRRTDGTTVADYIGTEVLWCPGERLRRRLVQALVRSRNFAAPLAANVAAWPSRSRIVETVAFRRLRDAAIFSLL